MSFRRPREIRVVKRCLRAYENDFASASIQAPALFRCGVASHLLESAVYDDVVQRAVAYLPEENPSRFLGGTGRRVVGIRSKSDACAPGVGSEARVRSPLEFHTNSILWTEGDAR